MSKLVKQRLKQKFNESSPDYDETISERSPCRGTRPTEPWHPGGERSAFRQGPPLHGAKTALPAMLLNGDVGNRTSPSLGRPFT
eukprot:6538967-Pyramimonas_sp.AAC.1